MNCHRLGHSVLAPDEALLDGLLLRLCLSLHLLCLDVCLLLHPLQLLQGDRVQREKLGFAQNKLWVAFLEVERNQGIVFFVLVFVMTQIEHYRTSQRSMHLVN